ncbi:MAG: AbgT family transporter [Bacteroidales bacterium]|nr:AbgT family transporter [Bacteroidales bacterium]
MLKTKKIPHTYVIIFYIIILSAIMTWFIPGGKYVEVSKMQDGVEKTELVFKYVENEAQTWQVFAALFKGFVKQSGIIVFILMIGGAFWIMNNSRAIDVGIFSFLKFTKKLERNKFFKKIGVDNIVMVLIMLMFSAFGAIFGMSEETIAFIIILVPLAISMGYDSITGVCLVFVAAGLGFAGAILNPFTIGIAQGIAELPLFSGIEYRFFCWIVINFVGIFYILRYARKVKKNPQSSIVYNDDEYWRKKENKDVETIDYKTPISGWITYSIILTVLIIFSFIYPITDLKIGNSSTSLPAIPFSAILFALTGIITLRKSVHFFVLSLLLYTIYFLIIGVMGYGWYIMKIATLFFSMGLMSGIAMNYNPNKITNLFLEGVKDILSAAVIVGLAGGIIVILEDGKVIDTILHGLSQSMNNLGQIASVGIMYIIQTIINVVIPSGSAKAALTMPIMAPFSDLIGISRQATVMAFQFGDGFTNMITPTSGVLIAVLGVAKIPYEKWVKWILPLMIILMILGFLLLIPTVIMPLNGF